MVKLEEEITNEIIFLSFFKLNDICLHIEKAHWICSTVNEKCSHYRKSSQDFSIPRIAKTMVRASQGQRMGIVHI